jgi:hypothetical protein
MAKFPWKTTLAGAVVLAGTVYAVAQLAPGNMGPHGAMMDQMGPQGGMMDQMGPMHARMMQMMHNQQGPMGPHAGMHNRQFGPGGATLPGNDAFGAIQEVVAMLEADPSTDWSKVDIAALREHLIDMNEVTLNAKADTQLTETGITIMVTGEGRTLAAIKRMVPAHVAELRALGWNASTEDLANGVKLTIAAADPAQRVRLKALGFMGIMVQGGHHQIHHLLMAKGEFQH